MLPWERRHAQRRAQITALGWPNRALQCCRHRILQVAGHACVLEDLVSTYRRCTAAFPLLRTVRKPQTGALTADFSTLLPLPSVY